ncbi:MAG: endolytic transglycosylase MltG [Oscillospiraceae bacterium]|nr:endolytic transglycosylase MltG [Oscillospiraceae bacterium]
MEYNHYDEQEESGFFPEEETDTPAFSESVFDAPMDAQFVPEEAASEPAPAQQPFDLSVLEDPELDQPEEEDIPADDDCETVDAEESCEEEPAPEPELFRDQDFRDAFGDGEEFDEIMNAPPAQEEIPVHSRPTRKGRPRRRKGELLFGLPQLAITCVWLAIILVVGVTLGRMLWVCAADVLAFGREDKVVTVTIYETDTIEDVTRKLHENDLIRYPGLFKLYADLAVDEGEIAPGIWDLNTNYDYHALVNMMSPRSNRAIVEDLLIPEGYTCRQIFALLEEKKICTAIDIAAYAATGELEDYWFLEGVERGDAYSLEGFLFPDTYDFYQNSSPREVLEKMLDNFETRFTEEMRSQIDTLNAEVTDGTFSVRDVVIVASMIEKESANAEESPRIASVIYNRLFDWGGNPAYLNIDASIVYALGGKTELTAEDLRTDHPYNTYTNIGLTPGPIANPGLASLKAALNPENTNYYFYVLNPATGTHKFSTTLDEHNEFIASLE